MLLQIYGRSRDLHAIRILARFQAWIPVQVGRPGTMILKKIVICQTHEIFLALRPAVARPPAESAGCCIDPVKGVIGTFEDQGTATVIYHALLSRVGSRHIQYCSGTCVYRM